MAMIHWRFGISGSFGTAADWTPAVVPTGSDNVFIDAAGTYTVTSSANHTVRALNTINTATLAVTGGQFTVAGGAAGAGTNAGTIRVGSGAVFAFTGALVNDGSIILNAKVNKAELIVAGNATLKGTGTVTLRASGHNFIVSNGSAATLTNASNTISGAGRIGDSHLTLVNETAGVIDGDNTSGALTLRTGSHAITNSGLMEGTTAKGLAIVSDAVNSGTIEAFGTNARVLIDGTITNSVSVVLGLVQASGAGAHVDLSSANINGGNVQVGAGSLLETAPGSGTSVVSGATITNAGTLQANNHSTLHITNSNIGTTGTLMSNGDGALLDIEGNVGAVSGTIDGGEIEFTGPSAADIAFAAGVVGTLKLDVSAAFTGAVSGFAGLSPNTFTQFLGFGDSTIDSGAFKYLSTGFTNTDARIQNGLANGGTASPVGVGSMNSQLLAGDFGLTADTAYAPGGGTDYAISGALDAAVQDNGNTGNLNPGAGLISTVDQISRYLTSTIDPNDPTGVERADPNALYLISSGGNDVTYAKNFISSLTAQETYLSEQATNLTAAIQHLYASGARHIIVNNSGSNSSLGIYYSGQLFVDLDAAGVPYVKSDLHGMIQDIKANPTAFGFTANSVQPGVLGKSTQSALIEPDTADTQINGWGLWGANTTTQQDSSVPLKQQYAYLRAPDAEQTSLFSDDQHLSAAGQLREANFDYSLLVAAKAISQDGIDFGDIHYAFGTTKATFSGDATGGTLTVTDGTNTANIALLGNYLASTFITASDGGTGTMVVNLPESAQQGLLASPHSGS